MRGAGYFAKGRRIAIITEEKKFDAKKDKTITKKIVKDGHTETIRTYETDKSGIEKLVGTETRDIK